MSRDDILGHHILLPFFTDYYRANEMPRGHCHETISLTSHKSIKEHHRIAEKSNRFEFGLKLGVVFKKLVLWLKSRF